MKVSLNWVKDYVKLPDDMDLKRLAYDLTMSTVEVEDATDLGAQFNNMVVGLITAIEQHPNADKLQVCKVDIGGEVKDIVCGGTNLYVGQKVAVAKPGSFCKWHGQGDPVEIKESKLRGVPSFGMICGAVEIGLADLFPVQEETHILDLTAFDAPAGTPIADALDLNDIILEIDNKSMTNRPDLWGHYGIAREIAALYDLPMKRAAISLSLLRILTAAPAAPLLSLTAWRSSPLPSRCKAASGVWVCVPLTLWLTSPTM